jgi:hypothetical protein
MHRSSTLILIAFALILATSQIASAYDVTASLSLIEDHAAVNELSLDEKALFQAYALFDSKKLPSYLRVEGTAGPLFFCGTPAILSIRAHMDEYSPEVRTEIESYLIPKNPIGSTTSKAPKMHNPNGASTPNSYESEHMSIKWGNNTTLTQQDMEQWADIFEEVWSIQVDTWGWDPVMESDNYYIDSYLGDSGDGAPSISFSGAYTTVYFEPPYQPYMVFAQEIFYHIDSLKDVTSHEFFHTLEFTVAMDFTSGCYQYMGEDQTWGVEGGAVWAEEETYDELNGYKYYLAEYAANPHYRLPYNSGIYPYSRVIWWLYVTENFGGRDIMYNIWNDGCRGSLWRSTNYQLGQKGSDIVEEFKNFTVANIMDEYEEANTWTDFRIHKTFSSYPSEYVAEHQTLPQLFGTNYIKLLAPSSKESDTLYVQFEGIEELVSGRSMEWSVQFIAKTGATYDLTAMSVSDGIGSAEIEGFGSDYDEIIVVISPISDEVNATSGADYTIEFGTEPLTGDDDDDDDNDADDNDDDDQTSGGDDDDDDDDNGGCCG